MALTFVHYVVARINFALLHSVLIVRSASRLKLKSSHFRKCCEEYFYLCVRLMRNHMEIFPTAVKLYDV